MNPIPIEQITEGWWWVEEDMLHFKAQLQIVYVQSIFIGDGATSRDVMSADMKLVAYPVRAEKCPSFKSLDDYVFLCEVLSLEESIRLESMKVSKSEKVSKPEFEWPADPDAPIDPSLMEKMTWTKSEIVEIIEEAMFKDHDAKGCDVELPKVDLGENTKIRKGGGFGF